MKISVKAVLLSAFIFPGAGHFFLKKHIVGTVFSGATLAALYVVVTNAVERALQVTEKIQSGDVQLDITAITELISKQPTDDQSTGIAMAILLIVWLCGIADSYRVGYSKEKGLLDGS